MPKATSRTPGSPRRSRPFAASVQMCASSGLTRAPTEWRRRCVRARATSTSATHTPGSIASAAATPDPPSCSDTTEPPASQQRGAPADISAGVDGTAYGWRLGRCVSRSLADALVDEVAAVDVELVADLAGRRRGGHGGRCRDAEDGAGQREDSGDALHVVVPPLEMWTLRQRHGCGN